MCSLYGMMVYDNSKINLKEKRILLECLGISGEERGTDATGYSTITSKGMFINKYGKRALSFKFGLGVSKKTHAILGHTRATTHGSAFNNQNNHPFMSKKKDFSLAHNGVLYNYEEVREELELETKPLDKKGREIETDSYVAVQILEKFGLNFEGMKKLGESVDGSYNFTILDLDENIWIVRNNNPLVIYDFVELGTIVYTSTETMMTKAMSQFASRLNLHYKFDEVFHKEEIITNAGDIIKIDTSGLVEKESFNPQLFVDYAYGYGYGWRTNSRRNKSTKYKGTTCSTVNTFEEDYDWVYDEVLNDFVPLLTHKDKIENKNKKIFEDYSNISWELLVVIKTYMSYLGEYTTLQELRDLFAEGFNDDLSVETLKHNNDDREELEIRIQLGYLNLMRTVDDVLRYYETDFIALLNDNALVKDLYNGLVVVDM